MGIPWEEVFLMKAIYKWTNLQNGKVYIGKSVNITKRLREYRYEVKKGNQRPIIAALRKYGFDKFKFEIIEDCDNLTNEQLLEREQYWMNYYNAQNRDFGYNILDADESPAVEYSQGAKNVKAKLNEEKVLDIREAIFLQNIPPAEVYKMYANEISFDAFRKAYTGKTWTNVDMSMIRDLGPGIAQREGKPKAKVTKDDVIKIRALADDGWTISQIYDTYFLGVCTRSTIKRIVNRETWKNI